MKTFLLSILACFAMAFFIGCETTSPSGDGATAPATSSSSSVKPYPLSTCLVTGEGLESKGGAITQVYQGQEVKVCCKPCQIAFRKNPELFMAKL